jgi:uncharacterized membrane protein
MLFEFIDGLLISYLTDLIGFKVPGLGLVIILFTITLIGFLARPFFSNHHQLT